MASLLIRKMDDRTKSRLRVRAAQHGRSMEEEAREILRSALISAPKPQENLAEAIRRRFARFGGVELPKIKREPPREPPDFSS
jgi:plasmid stability protein